LNGQPYSVKGVDYSVIPIGQCKPSSFEKILVSDFSFQLRQLVLLKM
jgi:hypothetical protein